MHPFELPQQCKNLYRHWPEHAATGEVVSLAHAPIPDTLRAFILERLAIWEKKVSGAEPPYTDDPVLQRYRFCNIFRECDRQTIEFHTMLNSLRDDFPLWLLNMFYCRMVARTETIRTVGLLSFNKAENREVYERLLEHPRPKYGTPYVFPISVIQKSATPTRELFIAEYLPTIMPVVAAEIAQWKSASVFESVPRVLELFGFNLAFLWTEVLIDVAYQFPERIDLFKRFPIGPGSLPTFRTLAPHTDSSIFVAELAEKNFVTNVTVNGRPLRLSAENWEGIGCEFRKYTNLTQGLGRKRLYTR
jgi:hypothetical protein